MLDMTRKSTPSRYYYYEQIVCVRNRMCLMPTWWWFAGKTVFKFTVYSRFFRTSQIIRYIFGLLFSINFLRLLGTYLKKCLVLAQFNDWMRKIWSSNLETKVIFLQSVGKKIILESFNWHINFFLVLLC